MARRPANAPLNVYLNARLVGRLRRESAGAIDFTYDKSWLAWSSAIPVSVSLPLREDRYIGAPVLAVFDNLLPDNDDIRRRVAERSHAHGADAYSLFAAIGRDCVGALQFLPDGENPGTAGTIDARPVTDQEIAETIGNLARNPLGIGADQEFRISLAGAQEKTALLYWKGKWHVPHGTTATTHIIKPQIGHLPNGIDLTNSVENEHFCLELVAALGLPAAKSRDHRISPGSGARDRTFRPDLDAGRPSVCAYRRKIVVRPYRSRRHANMNPTAAPASARSSEFLKGSDTPEADQRPFLKAQMVFWLLGATDGHAKNFSIHFAPGGRFRLTPLYDIISTQPSLDAGQIRQNQMKLAMAVGTNRHYVVHTIVGRHFVQTAQACGLPDRMATDLIAELKDTAVASIDQARAALPKDFPEMIAASIADGTKKRLKALATMDGKE